jgi:3-hydroxyacyl-[acyl-carrier-protein] dehydratase
MNEPTSPSIAMPVDVERIQAMLPHRYPFLLVDRVTDFTPNKKLTALKNVTINEPFFQGHFPGHPVMPGVLIIEALAQASGLLVFLSAQQQKSSQPMYYLVKVDNAKFSQLVVPGDQLILEVELKRMLRRMGLFHCRAVVAGKQVAEAQLLCAERSEG